MSTADLESFVQNTQQIYETRLRANLEKTHPHEFVAIEPVSGDYFLGKTLSEAGAKARDAHPDRLSHIMRVGHKAAIHFGIALN